MVSLVAGRIFLDTGAYRDFRTEEWLFVALAAASSAMGPAM